MYIKIYMCMCSCNIDAIRCADTVYCILQNTRKRTGKFPSNLASAANKLPEPGQGKPF